MKYKKTQPFQLKPLKYLLNRSYFLMVSFLLVSSPVANADTQTINLNVGWNLISFAVLPQDKTPANVLQSLENAAILNSIWGYDAAAQDWSTYPSPFAGTGASEITGLETGKGYWIKVASATQLVINDPGNSVQAAPMDLQLGWNLFGSVSSVPQAYQNVFNGVSVTELAQFDSLAGQFNRVVIPAIGTPSPEDFTELLPGLGYWVFVTQLSDIEPVLGTALPGDIDVDPLLPAPVPNIPTPWTSVDPGDIDIGLDGFYDRPETQRAVDLGDNLDRQNLSIFNTNTGIMNYKVSVVNASSTPWLKLLQIDEVTGAETLVTEITGSVTTETAIVQLVGDRIGLLPGQETGQIRIESNGGAANEPLRDIVVTMDVADLVGDYRILVNIDTVNGKKADLHNPRYFMSLYRDAGSLKGIIDDKQTLLVPQRVHLTGDTYQDGTNNFTVSGSFSLPAGHPDNPYNIALRRDITLIGDRAGFAQGGALDLVGDYRETIRNILGEPIYLRGTFVATRTSPIPTVLDENNTQNQANLNLPDQSVQTSVINISDKLLLTGVQVTTNIIHTRALDLRVTLSSPNGTQVVLRDQSPATLGSQTFSTTDIPVESLDFFVGELSEGAWTLTIEDLALGETGQLIAWDLNLAGTSVNDISGTIANVGSGATVVLSGCGVVLTTTTGAGGTYGFNNLIDCVYSVTLQKDGFQRVTQTVVLNGQDVINSNITPATAAADAHIFAGLPSDGSVSLTYISNLTSGGLVARNPGGIDMGGEDAHDSATFDIDRPPYGVTSSPVEDSNNFLDAVNNLTNTNALGLNGSLDGPVGSGPHYRMSVSIGQAIIGLSVSGNQQLLIGANQ